MIISVIDGEQLWLYHSSKQYSPCCGNSCHKALRLLRRIYSRCQEFAEPAQTGFQKTPSTLAFCQKMSSAYWQLVFSSRKGSAHSFDCHSFGLCQAIPSGIGTGKSRGGRAFAPAAIDGSVCRPAGDAGRLAAVFPETRRISFQNWENIFPVPAFSESQYIIRMERCP